MDRITVTLPVHLVKGIDLEERNRSRFVQMAVERELKRRRRERLRESVASHHPETKARIDDGLEDWISEDDAEYASLLDPNAGRDIRWSPGTGWHKR